MQPDRIHADRILILDFGSQYTQLIARRIRAAGVYSEIYAYDVSSEADAENENETEQKADQKQGGGSGIGIQVLGQKAWSA